MNPAQVSEPGTGAIDLRIGKDTAGPPNNWRRQTPPAGEDGTVPDLRLTISDQTDVITGGGVQLTLFPSTFDFPDSEMG